MTNHCGECTACCRVFDVPEVKSPAGEWCQHCAIGVGCKIYADRPATCVEFECLWLMSQTRDDPGEHMPPEMRPDRSKVVFSASTNEHIFAATLMPGAGDVLARKGVRRVIANIVQAGGAVVLGLPRSTRRTMYDRNGSHEVHLTEPDETGMQWNIPD
jgi:hypothetical protein